MRRVKPPLRWEVSGSHGFQDAGVEAEKVGPEISDALGEVCNMIAGNFKNKISGLSEGCMLSVPTVITARL